MGVASNSLMIGKLLVSSFDFWLLQMIPPSAFSGERCFSWVLHSKSSMWCSSLWWKQSLCRCLHLGWIPGDRCCAPLDPFCVSSLVDSTLLLGCWDHSFVPQTHLIEVSGSRRTELTRSCQGPPLKSEWQKVGSNSGPTAPEARTLPILHAPLLRFVTYCQLKCCHNITTLFQVVSPSTELLKMQIAEPESSKNCTSNIKSVLWKP